jgi:hypothetical protein
MANDPFYLKQHDTAPSWVYDIQDDIDTTPTAVNLTGATSVHLLMRLTGSTGTPKINAAMTVTDATNGRVTYDWATGDTDTVGTYDVDHLVTWSDGSKETFPNHGHETVIIEDDLSD